ncbi:MAG: prevent-host-death family protein [Mycobacterium sp.]|jgi:prevent-host-death family protein|nr:prevent-host-death family protein [Mycobacterium sp.]
MEQIGIRELRQHASVWVAKVKAGATIQITERGRPVARLVPVSSADQDRDALAAAGLLIPAPRPRTPLDVADLLQGRPLTPILDEQRSDR